MQTETVETLDWLGTLYGDPMSVFSSLLRSMIVAPKGYVLDVADYAAIEARVLFWVAKHADGIKAFKDGRKLYEELATDIFNVPLPKVTTDQRFVGKQATLGCGYGMGFKKFEDTCRQLGQEVSEELAQTAVRTYREKHKPVVKLWSNLERAAVAAIQNPGKKYSINYTSWYVSGDFLWCQLPSGRRLAYYGPRVAMEPPKWDRHGEKRPRVYHWGVDSRTRKWCESPTYGGKLTENVVQAISRDLMGEAMLRIEAHGAWRIVLSVHDELVAERDLRRKDASTELFCKLMATVPDWAEGAPVKVEGWSGLRYRK